jgi:hypothetical protein
MYRRGFRAEALTIGSLTAVYITYVAGYFVPFGGFVPGPRFLIPILPFLGVALAPAFKRLPLTSLALGAISVVLLTVITATGPLLAFDGRWWDRLASGWFAGHSWYLVLPFALLVAFGLGLALTATPAVRMRDASVAAAAVAAWVALWVVAPEQLGWSAADALRVATGMAVAVLVATVVARDVRLAGRWRSGRLSPTRSPRPRSSPI